MAVPDRPADRHREIGRVFTDRVRGTRSWDVPAPVSGWVARDVVRHLVEWLPAFLAAGSPVRLPAVPAVDDDPGGRPPGGGVARVAGYACPLRVAIDPRGAVR
jgi:hypothetical protein